jgi:hypothetical protein
MFDFARVLIDYPMPLKITAKPAGLATLTEAGTAGVVNCTDLDLVVYPKPALSKLISQLVTTTERVTHMISTTLA